MGKLLPFCEIKIFQSQIAVMVALGKGKRLLIFQELSNIRQVSEEGGIKFCLEVKHIGLKSSQNGFFTVDI